MTRATKYIILGAGLIGLIAFFMPLIAVNKSGVSGKLSAYRIVVGISSAKQVVSKAGKAADTVESKAAVKDANKALSAVRGIVLAIFVPALLLTIFGGVGTLRKSFGRGLAIPSFIFGLIGLGIWALLSSAASAGGGESVAGFGMHMLLLTGLGGVVGGLIGIIKPERRALPTEQQLATAHV